MTTPTAPSVSTPYEQLRQRHVADAAALVPTMMDRLTWAPERLAEHRETELRRLLRVARDSSPWHRRRLRDVDVDAVDETTLAELPVMTKDQLMANFDDVVTDDRLRLDVVEKHMAGLSDADSYLFDRYHVCASSGSSGRRGVFVYDWDAWTTCYWTQMRHIARAFRADPALSGAPLRMGMVAASAPTHMTSNLAQTFASPQVQVGRFPVTSPLAEIVAGLNAFEPTLLMGYPSALHRLTEEARAGRLRISPRWVCAASEVLLPETREALVETFRVPVSNWYGTSEVGGTGAPCRSGPSLHLPDDLVIIEPVDAAGRPVPPGVRCAKLYLTCLYNHAQPLIRYELTDQFEVLDGACACGSTHRRIGDPYGRLDDAFDYGSISVHPHLFRSPLSRRREIVEYQVRQTPRGATIAVRALGAIDLAALAAEITDHLRTAGLGDPEITVVHVEAIERPASGKLARFLPLR